MYKFSVGLFIYSWDALCVIRCGASVCGIWPAAGQLKNGIMSL